MIECQSCLSPSRQQYLFTECNHLLCLTCAYLKWDQKYSIRCCKITTFLEEESNKALQLLRIDEGLSASRESSKENLCKSIHQQYPIYNIHLKEQGNYKLQSCQDTSIISSCQKDLRKVEEQRRIGEKNAQNRIRQMESLLHERITVIKAKFDQQRKQIDTRQQKAIRELIEKYSQDLQNLNKPIGEENTLELRIKSSFREEQSLQQDCGKGDKILEKLEYNQLKMKQKLNRHYQMLKAV